MRGAMVALALVAGLLSIPGAQAVHGCRTATVPVALAGASDTASLTVCPYQTSDFQGWTGTIYGSRAAGFALSDSLGAAGRSAQVQGGAGFSQFYLSGSGGSSMVSVLSAGASASTDAAGQPVGAGASASYVQLQTTYAAPCTDSVAVSAGTTLTGTVSHAQSEPCKQPLPLLPGWPAMVPHPNA